MGTTFDGIADAIVSAIAAELANATVGRNMVDAERVPEGGLIIVDDGDPGEPEYILGGSSVWYSHTVGISVFSQSDDQATRDELFSELCAGIGDAIEADRSLGGLCRVTKYKAPYAEAIVAENGQSIKNGVILVTVDYMTDSPLD